jgi:hypothetical protein
VRSVIIWSKPNPMPESVRDRPTTAHEYVLLLTKSARYFYDADAIREPLALPDAADGSRVFGGKNKHGANLQHARTTGGTYDCAPSGGRNKRTVWEIATQPYSGPHYATFPPKLVEPMVLTTPTKVCAECGAGWERVVEQARASKGAEHRAKDKYVSKYGEAAFANPGQAQSISAIRNIWREEGWGDKGPPRTTLGFRPTCSCYDELYRSEFPKPRGERKRRQRDAWDGRWKRVRKRPGKDHWQSEPPVILDPCCGTGTTLQVADHNGRGWIGIDIDPKSIKMAEERLRMGPVKYEVSEGVEWVQPNLVKP